MLETNHGDARDAAAEWARGAERVLVACAKALDLCEPEEVLSYPRRLIPGYDELLRSTDLAQVTDDEFWQLCSQLLALVAPVMIVERQVRWVPDGASTTEGAYCLEVSAAGNPVRLDPAALVRQVFDSETPQATILVSLAEYQFDSATHRGTVPETVITRTFGSGRGV
ncbi:hypothetical protein AB0873_29025 [Micromonospora sp. NPDC047707]|uniref:hypothetical protein n=1 Tax=Micromonospora sp. NPDC047707 TaxID=3154498 RepID=UPI0034539810